MALLLFLFVADGRVDPLLESFKFWI